MVGIGWLEMLVIGVVALVFIGPKELPAMMQRVGKTVGAIRRMGQEFQREINRSTGLDKVTDLRKTITEPLKKTTAEIQREFNKIGTSGEVKPTGVIAPKDPKAESVVDEIKAKAGMTVTPAAEPVKTGAVGPVTPPEPPPASAEAWSKKINPPQPVAPTPPPAPPVAVESPAPVEALLPAAETKAAPKPRKKAPPRKTLVEDATAAVPVKRAARKTAAKKTAAADAPVVTAASEPTAEKPADG